MLRLVLTAFVLLILVIGVILILTLPPRKCASGCFAGSCTKTILNIYDTSSPDYVCSCPSNDILVPDGCSFKQWTPAALQQFYAALILLIPTTIILCCGCCLVMCTKVKARRSRNRVTIAAPPPPPITSPPAEAEEEEEEEEADNDDVPPDLPEDDVESQLIIETTALPPGSVTYRQSFSHSSSAIIPLASVSTDSVYTARLMTESIRTKATVVDDEIEEAPVDAIEPESEGAYLEAVVLGTFAEGEEIDEMAEWREMG